MDRAGRLFSQSKSTVIGLTGAWVTVAEVNVHVIAFTLPATVLGSGASTEARPLSGSTSTRNSAGSPGYPGRPLPIHCPQTSGAF